MVAVALAVADFISYFCCKSTFNMITQEQFDQEVKAIIANAIREDVGDGDHSSLACIPTNATVAFEIGTVISIEQQGAGVVTIAPISGVTINATKLKTDGQNAVVQAYKVDTDTWNVIGGIA